MNRARPGARRATAAGFSLIELMVSMLIGLIVLGAMFAAYLASGTSSRTSRALSQMTEDAAVAMNVLRSHVGMAGFSQPAGVGADGRFTRVFAGTSLFGCGGQFVNPGVAMDALSCDADLTAPDALAVAYQADTSNSLDKAGVPLDCLGNSLPAQGVPPNVFYVSYSRFFVANTGLNCLGPGNAGAQMLVEHVHDLQALYGVANDSKGEQVQATYYAAAPAVTADAVWGRVVSVRLCLVVKSEDEVLDVLQPYVGCDPFAAPVVPTDRRMYRAFTSTIVMHNRLGVAL
jgi:type IV pilus assembly protein PilW